MGFYRITSKARRLLARPQGRLFTGPPEESIEKAKPWIHSILEKQKEENKQLIYLVGDIVSEAFLSDSELVSLVHLAFIDGITQRGKPNELELPQGFQTKKLKNPAGTIQESVIKEIRYLVENPNPMVIEIEGEEDLLAIPLLNALPSGRLIFYGQPPITAEGKNYPAGLVGIEVTETAKAEMDKLLQLFEHQPQNAKF